MRRDLLYMSLFVGDDDEPELEPGLEPGLELGLELAPELGLELVPDTNGTTGSNGTGIPGGIPVDLPLKYQQEIVNDLLTKDALLILAKGLGWEIIVSNILYILNLSNMKDKLPNPPKNRKSLLVLLNANETENTKIQSQLQHLQCSMTVISGEGMTADKRKQVYETGGIVSITSRIFVVDFLSEILSPNEVNGLFVLHAETIKETSNESFIVNLYRDQNEWGFIKAFSDDPEAFTGFTPLYTRLKNLKLSNTLLWPRFHVDVIESLSFRNKKHHIDLKRVNELNVPLSYKMNRIQQAILTCIDECLKELIRHCQTLATEYWSIENLYDDDFVQRIRLSLNSLWHRLTQTPKQLVFDLGFLKNLLTALLTKDSLSFYQIVQNAVDSNVRNSTNSVGTMNMTSLSPWLNSDVAPTITSFAKERALGLVKYVDDEGIEMSEYALEPLPKWAELSNLLTDIGPDNTRVLIMASDKSVVQELEYLVHKFVKTGQINTRQYMISKLRSYLLWQELSKFRRQLSNDVNNDDQDTVNVSKTFKRSREVESSRRRSRGASSVARVNRLYSANDLGYNPESVNIDQGIMERLEREIEPGAIDPGSIDLDLDLEPEPEPESNGERTSPRTSPIKQEKESELDDVELILENRYRIRVRPFNTQTQESLLEDFSPTHIIFFEPNLTFIRRVENYQAKNHKNPSKIYLMYYGTSAEEQRSLAQMKREKESFTKLIREKANLSKHFETKEDSKFSITKQNVVNTRIAGGQRFQTEDDEFRVIVDVREFNSSLPNLLYRVGSKVIPCMLTVGDYILTPKICVERKAIPDLIASFKSGRLYNQCEQMFRYYETPVVLIEFDENKSFSFEPFSEPRNFRNPNAPTGPANRFLQDDIQGKLSMLLVSFPKLKIIWSSSPYKTAQIFLELKAGEEAPDITQAINKGLKSNELPSLYNEEAIDLLQSIPGINSSNYLTIMNKVKNIEQMVQLEREEFVGLLGEENGNKAYNFITRQIRPSD